MFASRCGGIAAVLAAALMALHGGSAARAVYTPKSPEVQKLIVGGLSYLRDARHSETSGLLGGRCVVGMAFVKNGHNENHPRVKEAVEACRRAVKVGADKSIRGDHEIYSLGIAVIFLCSLETGDPDSGYKYGDEIRALLKSLEVRQKPGGGWGYANRGTGDTSMTQYGVLSTWEVQQIGIEVSTDSIERVTNWLIRTQDPSGGFGYQGIDPGTFVPQKQQEVRLSLAPAGLGSLYICGDVLGHTARHDRRRDDLPPALRIKKTDSEAQPKEDQVVPARLLAAKARGNGYMAANYRIDEPGWTHYYLYALERYHSFREVAEGKAAGSRWYDDGVRYLQKTQREDGSWSSMDANVDTAFAVLFLTRASQKSIQRRARSGGGVIVGGRGLPRSLKDVEIRGGRVIARKFAGPAEDQIAILEKGPQHPDYYEVVRYHGDILADTNEKTLRDRAERLRRLLVGGSADARMVAAQALGKVRDLDQVPTLIYALTDPDWRVVVKARDSLRAISRKFDGFGPPTIRPADEQAAELARVRAIDQWKAWYKMLRPDARFAE